MEKKFGQNDPKLLSYAESVFRPEDEVLRAVRIDAVRTGLPEIQVGAMDGLHLEILVRAAGAKKVVEVGTLGGYSGICIARGLPVDGRLYTFEIEPEHAKFAAKAFEKAGVAEKVEIHVGVADVELPKINAHGPFDLIFIDADKVSYPKYLSWAEENLRVGGVVVGDNTFGWGMITDTKFEDQEDEASIKGLQEFNRRAAQSGRFRATILPTGEGLTVAVKMK